MVGYCTVCSCNYTEDEKNHPYTKTHTTQLQGFLIQQQEKMKQYHKEMQTPVLFNDLPQEELRKYEGRIYWCDFCECDIRDNEEQFHKFSIFRHLAGIKHEKSVIKLLQTHVRKKELKKQFKKKHFRLTQGSFAKYKERIVVFDEEKHMEEEENQDNPTATLETNTAPVEEEKQKKVKPFNVREEIIVLVRMANERSKKKTSMNPKRHRNITRFLPNKRQKTIALPNFGSVWETGPRSLQRTAYNHRNK